LGDYSATINWGDGTSSSATVTADPNVAGQFDVSGSHTYAEEGPFTVAAAIFDNGGSTATALATITERPTNGSITYHLAIDTTGLAGSTGSLAFQFNPAALPDSQSATVTVTNFVITGGSATGGPTFHGGASGSLTGTATFSNSSPLNELT